MTIDAPHPLDFFAKLKWLDGRNLLDTIEPYRREIFSKALYTFDADGNPQYSLALCGRAKKNWKSCDLILAALYRFLVWPSAHGNDGFVLANDEGQAADDLSLAKKLIAVNPAMADDVKVEAKSIHRKDGAGALKILPARDISGAHGKTYLFCGYDEIHGYRSHDLFEALAPDPTRNDVLTWITSYAGIRHAKGIPLFDYMEIAKSGADQKMFFSWYSSDYTTDEAFKDKDAEQRANPSMASWNNPGYLKQQKARLPTHKYRRLHLNLPGAPDGAAFDGEAVVVACSAKPKRRDFQEGTIYRAFVDMSGGSGDDATLAIAHFDKEQGRHVLDLIVSQTGAAPFNPRTAVTKFAGLLKEYGLSSVMGDSYAGNTFVSDFKDHGITYTKCPFAKSVLYDQFEPKLNAGVIDLLNNQKLQEQLLTLVVKSGGKIDHQDGDHDDFANACAGAIWLTHRNHDNGVVMCAPIIVSSPWDSFGLSAGSWR